MARTSRNLILLPALLLALAGRSFAASTATITVTGTETGDTGSITISMNVSGESTPATETVTYGPYSTPASIAAAFGLRFTRDYNPTNGELGTFGLTAGVNCSGHNYVITFTLASGTFGALEIAGSTTSFNLNAGTAPPIGFGPVQQFGYANGQLTMSTNQPDLQIFYTTDGSAATEASIQNPGTAITLSPGTLVNAVVVQTTNSGNNAVIVQNGQNQVTRQKTVVSCSNTQCGPFNNTPNIDYGAGYTASGCVPPSQGGGASDGVCGVPTAINYSGSGSNPALSIPNAGIPGNAVEKDFTTEGSSLAGGPATQVLWPYDYPSGTTGGCDTCTTMVEDFYIWPEYSSTLDPGVVENYELDMNQWNIGQGGATTCDNGTAYCYGGASMQASIGSRSWQYNGQVRPGWTNFPSPYITHDLVLPFGTLAGAIGTETCSTTAIPLTLGQTSSSLGSLNSAPPERGMIVYIEGSAPEEIFVNSVSGNSITSCVRGYGGTTAQPHSSSAKWVGSVHVQYHVTLAPTATATKTSPTLNCSNGVVFIDYLILNNNYYGSPAYDFYAGYMPSTVTIVPNGSNPTWWPLITSGANAGKSTLFVCYDNSSIFGIDRVFDQKQLDVNSTDASAGASVGDFTDQDNVTATFGIYVDFNGAGKPLVYSFLIP